MGSQQQAYELGGLGTRYKLLQINSSLLKMVAGRLTAIQVNIEK